MKNACDRFGYSFAAGCSVVVTLQACINNAVATSLTPKAFREDSSSRRSANTARVDFLDLWFNVHVGRMNCDLVRFYFIGTALNLAVSSNSGIETAPERSLS
jgi:hypothetical protein